MPKFQTGVACVLLAFLSLSLPAAGPLARVANSTLHFPTAPPGTGYVLTDAFGSLTFPNPVGIVSPPGETNRLFIIEQGGRISVITNLANPTRTVFLDISGLILGGTPTDERGLLGLAFHPGYSSNGYFFVYYTGTATTAAPGATNAMHDILARYRVSASNRNQADPASEVRFLRQYDQANNHNAGDIHFGSDGYLYLSLGDEGDSNDSRNNSQTITKDFFSAIIRIDVDKKPGNTAPNAHPSATTNYLVPADNPFLGAIIFNGVGINPSSIRTEFWAVGLRNPWRFTFDPVTGFLYCADVGQGAWEEINIIKKGGNYGWAYREGAHAGPKTPPAGFTSIDPIQEYAHGGSTNQGTVVTGGVVYRGATYPAIAGAYFFADYGIGNIWYLRYDGTNTVPFRYVANEANISAFGVDPRNGDILMANQSKDTIRRLIAADSGSGGLPATLADTGAFTNLSTLTPNPGIVAYDINLPFWSDNATKRRWFSIPDTNLDIVFNSANNWTFPTGTVWIKHFELQLTNGVAASNKRLETRFIVKSTNGIYGLTYRWGNSLTNAVIVAEGGMDESFVINQGGGVLRTQVWHYPSRAECQRCHTPEGGFGLGFNTAQLNCAHDYGTGATNQIAALSDAGYFTTLISNVHTLPALAHVTNSAVSREYRARSYLAANCSFCHQPGGSAQGLWDGRVATPTALAGLINGPLLSNGGNSNSRVVVPGSLTNSMLLARIATLGATRMPPLDSTVLDTQAVALVSAWITNDLPGYQSFANWQISRFGSTNAANAAPGADPDGDKALNELEYLTGTDPTNAGSAWRISARKSNGVVQITFPQIANRGFEVQEATNANSPASWRPLDVTGNEPFFAITNGTKVVTDTSAPRPVKWYRVRVFAP